MSTEEGLARLESGYDHLATKAGLESVRGELKAEIETLRGEVRALAGSFKVWIIIAAILQAGFSALFAQLVNSGS